MFVSLWSTTSATLCAVLLSVASSVSAAAATAEESPGPTSESAYRLHHRIFHPAFERPLFAPRGLVHLRGPDGRGLPFVESAKDVQEHMDGFAAALRTGAEAGENTDGVLYQVALERPGDANERAWDVSSVRAVRYQAFTSYKSKVNPRVVSPFRRKGGEIDCPSIPA
jgi:hypothetical protein